MDSSSAPPQSDDDSDDYLIPQRSPSRLDFCLDILESDGDPPTDAMDWSTISLPDHCPYTFVEEDAFDVDIAPPASQRLLILEAEDDPPQATDSHAHESADSPPLFFASSDPEPMEEIVLEPQAPTPHRHPSMQMQAEVQEAQDCSTPPRIAPHRLNYPHHGFSRSALFQQKILWNSRHEEWVAWQSRQGYHTDDAYTGLANLRQRVAPNPPPCMRPPPSGLERDLADQPPRRREQDLHSSVFPRVGDISALRDPYAANIDRSFYRLPLWTLHKMLYAFDMQQRSASPTYDACHVQASVSSSTLSSYSSSTSGEDEESDSTLVAEDSPVHKSQLPPELPSSASPRSPLLWCGWGLSWHARWQVLIGIFQGDHTRYDAFEYPEALTAPPSPSKPIFRFTVGDEDNDEDDDDEEDYGTPIANPTFSSDFDDECERALAFYSRELSPEVTW